MRRIILCVWNLLVHITASLLNKLLGGRLGDSSETRSSELIPYKRSEFPIRVVDVEETLKNQRTVVFKKPETWQDFHIISHTWSQMVRDLSVEIGASIALISCTTSSSSGTFDSYAAAFQEADLSRNRCYVELSRVLEWLASDGVKGVWMDALCINQMDVNEKSREISRMGDYYGKSQGCYVIPNGIGQMYGRLCSRPSPSEIGQKERRPDQVLPRWFYRVWTLQEYLLPSHLSFLVGDLQPAFIRLINAFICSRSKSAVGFCNCCCIHAKDDNLFSLLYRNMNPHHRHPDPVQAEKDALVSEAFMNHVEKLTDAGDQSANTDHQSPAMSTALECIDGSQILAESSGAVCGECGSRPRIRRVASCSSMYFVEAPAYDVLLCLVAGSKWEKEVDVSSSQVRSMKEAAAAVATDDQEKFDTLEVLWVAAMRECSHEEDGVLGILGLLHGFHERQLDQVRADKTMEEQVIFVARQNFEFAFSLVVYSEDCFLQVPGLSWASDLKDNGSNPHGDQGHSLIAYGIFNSRSGRYAYDCVRLAQITKVTHHGYLHVSARVAQARLRYLAPIDPSSNCVSDVQSSWRLQNVRGCPAINGARLPDTRNLLSATLKVGQITDDGGCPLSSLEFDVHLIILESFIKPARRVGQPGHPCVRIMVCCGQDPQSNLHNLCNTYVSATEILVASPSTPIDCQIGGYGKEIPREALTNACLEFKRGKGL